MRPGALYAHRRPVVSGAELDVRRGCHRHGGAAEISPAETLGPTNADRHPGHLRPCQNWARSRRGRCATRRDARAARDGAGGHLDRGARSPAVAAPHTRATTRAAGDFRRQQFYGIKANAQGSTDLTGRSPGWGRPRRTSPIQIHGRFRRAACDRCRGTSGCPRRTGSTGAGRLWDRLQAQTAWQPVRVRVAHRQKISSQADLSCAARTYCGGAAVHLMCWSTHCSGDLAAGGVLPGRAEFRYHRGGSDSPACRGRRRRRIHRPGSRSTTGGASGALSMDTAGRLVRDDRAPAVGRWPPRCRKRLGAPTS